MDEQLRIVIAHAADQTREQIRASLRRDWPVVSACGSVAELMKIAASESPDLLVTGIHFEDGSGIEAAIQISQSRPIPAVIVTARHSMDLVKEAMRDHVMAYLIEPVTAEDLQASVIVAHSRFSQLRELEEQVGDLRQALGDRKLIERAKGILMAADQMTEDEAFSHLRREAQNRRAKMVTVADEIIAGAERAAGQTT